MDVLVLRKYLIKCVCTNDNTFYTQLRKYFLGVVYSFRTSKNHLNSNLIYCATVDSLSNLKLQ